MDYCFYFDETFHDRKITIGAQGIINSFRPDSNDSYIGVFWGCEKYRLTSVVEKISKIEEEYHHRFSLPEKQEFKSTIISKKNFRKGIRTFVSNTYDFYYDYFSALADSNVILHINMLSKMEILVRNIFPNITSQFPEINSDSFYYSLTKFMVFCHTPELINALYNAGISGDGDAFKSEILIHLSEVIKADKGVERKVAELEAYRKLKSVIRRYKIHSKVDLKYDFVYEQNFIGLKRLLEEKRIPSKKVILVIDREEKTAKAAENHKFKRIEQIDSRESVQIRIADQLCGFIGRMIYALSNDTSIKEDPIGTIQDIGKGEHYQLKHLLDEEWFNINEKQFELYHLVYKVFIEQQLGSYWATMTWSYGDQASMFYSLLRYFAGYDTFAEYAKVKPGNHSEYYNSLCCEDLMRHYKQME